jgi:hypothetical protein
MMKYEFVTRSIPTLWKNIEGVLLVSSTGFAPGSIYGSTFLAWYNASNCFHGVLEYTTTLSPETQGPTKERSTSIQAFRLLCDERDVACRCVDEPNRRAATGPVLCRLHHALAPARHTALCRDAAPLRAIIGSCGARLARIRARPVGVAPHTRPAMHMRGPLSS